MKNKKVSNQSSTGPTPEALSQGEYVVEEASTIAGHVRFRRVDSTELDRLLFAGKISPHHHQIGEEFLAILHRAQMIGVAGGRLESGSLHGGERDISERQARAYSEASRIIQYVKDKGGNKIKDMILGVLLEDRPVTSGKHVYLVLQALRLVGDFFADRYGWNPLPNLGKKKGPTPERVRPD
jgi:hypothetical protein